MSCQIIPKALIVGLGVMGLVCWSPGIWAKPSPSQISHLQIPRIDAPIVNLNCTGLILEWVVTVDSHPRIRVLGNA